jgi:hypothetical protein
MKNTLRISVYSKEYTFTTLLFPPDGGEEAESRSKGAGSISHDRNIGLLKKLEAGEDLYPSCDTSVWLRSCSQEVVDPLEGKVTGESEVWKSLQL